MKNVSYKFKEIIHNGGPFYAYAKVVLADGQELEFDSENDFLVDGNGYSESGGVSSFPLGVAVAKAITLNLDNSNEKYSNYDFYYARITLYTEAELDNGTTERIKEGTFTVTSPVANGDVIEIEAINDMYKANITYIPNISFPATLLQITQDVCSQCEILLGSPSFTNQGFTVKAIKGGMTCREVLGYIAQIAGGNAICDENNRLLIKTYDLSVFEQRKIISGENLRKEVQDRISGGTFGENIPDTVQGGTFGENDNFHVLASFPQNPEISTDDVVITGLATTYTTEVDGEEQDVEYLYGEEGYVLSIDNPLIEGKEQEALQKIGTWIIGISVRPFSAQHTSYPIAEFMDPVYVVDTKNNVYESFLTDIEYEYLSNTTLSNSTESPARNNSEYYSQASAAYRKAREELQNQKSEWEKAMEDLSNRLDNSSGLYMTAEKQSDGSSIYYMHNKPTKEESSIIWKMTAEAMAVSTDGGKTWNAGITVDGALIAKILNTIGINFDWGTGGTLTLGGKNNENGKLIMLDASGKEVGRWNNGEFYTSNGNFTGKIKSSNAEITGGYLQADLGSKEYSFIVLRYGDNFEVYVRPTGMRVSYQETYCDMGGTSFSACNEARASSVSPYGIDVLDSPSTIDYNYPRTSMSANTFSVYASGNVMKSYMTDDRITSGGSIYAYGDIGCSGTKSRISKTADYNNRQLFCYETPSPFFGDLGEAETDDDGYCYIYLDDIFSQTINTKCKYQVFLQKEGSGDIWVDKKTENYFIVRGSPNLKFAWEVKAKQKGYEYERLEIHDTEPDIDKINYEIEGQKFVDLELQKYIESIAYNVTQYYQALEEMFI